MIARRRDMWAAKQYIYTTKNVLADLLSRSFTETGQDIGAVLVEFREEVRKLGLTAVHAETPAYIAKAILGISLI